VDKLIVTISQYNFSLAQILYINNKLYENYTWVFTLQQFFQKNNIHDLFNKIFIHNLFWIDLLIVYRSKMSWSIWKNNGKANIMKKDMEWRQLNKSEKKMVFLGEVKRKLWEAPNGEGKMYPWPWAHGPWPPTRT
jgi:hypothetical protein